MENTTKRVVKRFKKGDYVIITSGSSKGSKGELLKVIPSKGQVIVQGINMKRKKIRATATNPYPKAEKIEFPIDVSNIAHIDPKVGVPTRVGFKILESGKKVRYAKKSGELIDA